MKETRSKQVCLILNVLDKTETRHNSKFRVRPRVPVSSFLRDKERGTKLMSTITQNKAISINFQMINKSSDNNKNVTKLLVESDQIRDEQNPLAKSIV